MIHVPQIFLCISFEVHIWLFHRSKDFEAMKAGKLAFWPESSPNLNSCSIKISHLGTSLQWLWLLNLISVCLLSDTRHFLPALYWAQWLGSTIMWISKQNRANCHDGRWIQRTDICIVLVNLILCCWAILCQCFLEKLSFEKLCSKEMHTFQTIFSKLQPIWKTEKILLLGWKRHWDFSAHNYLFWYLITDNRKSNK